MSVAKAKSNYTGQDGTRRLNCAESIVDAFQEKFPLPVEDRDLFLSCGGGRAPGGICGSLFAAKTLLGKHRPDKLAECERALEAQAGSVKCREIRALKKLSCVGCVEKIAEFMDAA